MSENIRRRRDDGAHTRERILQAAAEVFASQGADRATGKVIAARAGTNSAAVNYYFGNLAGLYVEVLVRAHESLVSLEKMSAAASGDQSPAEKCARLIALVAESIMAPRAEGILLKVLIREIFNPSPAFEAFKQRQLLPKKVIVTGVIAEYLDLPPEDPAVAVATLATVAPFLILLIGDRSAVPQLFPEIAADAGNVETVTRVITDYTLAGLAEVRRRRHHTASPPSD